MVRKIVFRIIPLLITVFALIFPFLNITLKQQNIIGDTLTSSYKGILTLWHVENFEGGINSRENFLFKRAVEFEKMNEGVFIQVLNMTDSQALNNLVNGAAFDIISFSQGTGNIISSYLSIYDGKINTLDNFSLGINVEGRYYGVPYSAGGYAVLAYADMLKRAGINKEDVLNNLFSAKISSKSKIDSITMGFGAFNNPLKALASVTQNKGNFSPDIFLKTQQQAFSDFLSKQSVFLLGTQRDILRILARENAGKIEEMVIIPVSGFTDLVQYAGISKNADKFKKAMAVKFLEFLTSNETQRKLNSIGLIPVIEENIYTLEKYLEEFEIAVKRCETNNVFISQEKLTEERNKALR